MSNINNLNNANANAVEANNILINGRNAAETAKVYNTQNKAIEKIKAVSLQEERTDSFEKSVDLEPSESGIYSREALLEELRASEEQRQKAFMDTIRSMLAQQGQTVNLTIMGLDLHVTEEQRAAAKASISEGGEYSIDAVAGRIMDMAKALSGGDPSKLSVLRDAVEKGFKGAAKVLGKKEDEMPQITKDTYTEVMKRFDEWEKSLAEKTATDVSSNGAAIQAAAALTAGIQ